MYSMLLFLLMSYALEDTSLISQRPDNNIVLYCFLIKGKVTSHDIAEILIQLALNINQSINIIVTVIYFISMPIFDDMLSLRHIEVSDRQILTNCISGVMVSAFELSVIDHEF